MESGYHQEYEYKTRISRALPPGLFFALWAVVFGVHASLNERALNLNGVWLPPVAATAFYAAVAVVSFLCAAAVIYRVYRVQRIVLTSDAIVVPTSAWSSNETEIPYKMITGMREVQGALPSLMIVHRRGLTHVHASKLPTKAAYDEIRQVLADRVAEAQANQYK
jgi:hypothetical protein